jgi:ABC-2 type transport system ATP-binding protein
MLPLLEADALVKQFATVRAVDGLSFDLRPGEIFALLGPNGAGKTSTLRMAIGLLRPDTGTIVYRGRQGDSPRIEPRELGYLPEERGLYTDQPILRCLVYLAELRGLSRADARREALAWLERLELDARASEKVSALSKGNQQKVQLIAAVLHRPRIAILDEPFSGFDPQHQERALELMRELRDGGTAVLVSAHQLALVERLADRILVLDRGRAVLEGSLEQLRRRSGLRSKLTLSFAEAVTDEWLETLPGVTARERLDGRRVVLLLAEGAELNALLGALGGGARLEDVRSEAVGLHELYLRAVGQPFESGQVAP